MTVLFDADVSVHYGQLYLVNRDSPVGLDLGEHFRGQANGLCGAAVPESLFLITDRHTGTVALRIELHEQEPPVAADWAEVVEAAGTLTGEQPVLSEWGGRWYPLELPPGEYRVRYCGGQDRYLLQFWSAAPAPDAVLRVTKGAYWHEFARSLPPPPTPEQVAAARLRQTAEERVAAAVRARQEELRRWGGEPPSAALLGMKGNARKVVREHRAVAEAIAADPAGQRELAVRLARRACVAAGLAEIGWIASALETLARGAEPFEDWRAAGQRLLADPAVPSTVVPGVETPTRQQTAAFATLRTAALPDPLTAALETLSATLGTLGPDQCADLLVKPVSRDFT
ncbi:hypothetical protein [Crossiella sp. NPDC003009]